MRSRTWICLMALIGVLLHAGALARHNGVMVSAQMQHQALVADLHQLCNPAAGPVDPASLPSVPRPSDAQNGCPVCSGLAAPLIVPAPHMVALRASLGQPDHPAPIAAVLSELPRSLHPPARGPPSLA